MVLKTPIRGLCCLSLNPGLQSDFEQVPDNITYLTVQSEERVKSALGLCKAFIKYGLQALVLVPNWVGLGAAGGRSNFLKYWNWLEIKEGVLSSDSQFLHAWEQTLCAIWQMTGA